MSQPSGTDRRASPPLDGRTAADIRERLEALAPFYVDNWDPDSADAGSALLAVFSEMAGGLTARVDRAPQKHRIAFLDALGFDRRPPQPAHVPVTFAVDPDAPGNVAIADGTIVEAEGADEEVRFRIGGDEAFEATPSRLQSFLTVDPADDRLVDHEGALDGEPIRLFAGDDAGDNVLYLGHSSRLAVSEGETVTLRIEGSFAPGEVVWEYFGKPPAGEGSADADEPAWQGVEEVIDGEGTQLSLVLGGAVVETEVDGVESAWLRCRLKNGSENPDRFDVAIEAISILRRTHTATIDAAYATDIPQPVDGEEVVPFGEVPQRRDAFSLASADAFRKAGARVELTFTDVEATRPSTLDSPPRLSWEYFDGSAWQRLDVRSPSSAAYDTHDLFHRNLSGTADRTVTFEVPADAEPTSVAGREDSWIRVRIVAGEYVLVRYVGDDSRREIEGTAPRFSGISMTYTYGDDDRPEHLITANARAYVSHGTDPLEPFSPFEPLPDAEQTVYLGFDSELTGGPLSLYFELADREYPAGFDPRVRWEGCVDAAEDEWRRLPGSDGTDGLTRSGRVSLSFPEPTEATDRFGERRHWIRARVRGDGFEPGADRNRMHDSDREPTLHVDENADSGAVEPCESVLVTAPGGGTVDASPPLVDGVYINTTLAANVTVVTDAVVGSSDGSPGQTVGIDDAPLIDVEVWIDESAVLTAHERERLAADRPDRVDIDTRSDGSVRAVWVRWDEVTDLATADDGDRVYALDRIDGEITFGDGSKGQIPPRGRDAIRASYRVGGGSAGNVTKGAIEDLSTDITYIDEVGNPVGGGGGADTESTEAVLDRAPRALRDRDRATTAVDYERIAADAARELATVRCLRGFNPAGQREPGWVTILIVPDDRRETPQPRTALIESVERAVGDRAPLHLVAGDRIVVRGPTYVPVSTDATVVTGANVRLGDVENRIEDRLTRLLHPLSGNDGDGWAFGELPTVSDIIGAIERVSGVDHVPALRIHYEGAGGRETITKGEEPPTVSPDVLIRSGGHTLTVRPRERRSSGGS